MNRTQGSTRGFSFIEVVVVVAIIAVVATIALTNLSGRRSRTELLGARQQVATLLREAQARSVAQASSTSWGVRLENSTTTTPFYALFFGSYATSTRVGYYRLPSSVRYATSSLPPGSIVDVVFSQITGLPSTSTAIVLESIGGSGAAVGSSTITVNANGSIAY